MKVVKGFFKFILTVVVICLLAAIALVLSYTLSKPDTAPETSSRKIVSGPWEQMKATEKDEELLTFTFDTDGKFTIVQNKKTIADGFFKIDEKSSKIKLLILPKHHTKEFEKYIKYKVFAEVSYANIQLETSQGFNEKAQLIEDNLPTGSFLIRRQDGSEETDVFDCMMHEYTLDLYSHDKSLAKE